MYLGLALVVAVVAVVAVYLVSRSLSGRMTRVEFSQAVCSVIERDYPELSIKDAADFTLRCDLCGGEVSAMLDAAFLRYLQRPRDFETVVDHYVTSLAESRLRQGVSWEQAKRRLLPLLEAVKPPASECGSSDSGEQGGDVVSFEYEHGLRVVLMLDFEYASRPLTGRDLEEWGISSDEGLDCASNNLAVKTGPLWEDASDNARRTGLFKFRTLDGYDASRILLPDLPERAARALHCEKVAVAIPVQHALLAISADDDKDVSELRKNSMLIYQKGRYPLTPETFLMQSGD